LWFDFLRKRNPTTHTYQETEAEKVIEICPSFSNEVKNFLKAIGAS
ncbi:MAG: nucleotidyltransferase, partial [Alphaproteobacteria bacterium]|nr:nucleotidyltransferase [Alphaproteobacteria bacterium]